MAMTFTQSKELDTLVDNLPAQLPTILTQLKEQHQMAEKQGRSIYQNISVLRDVATVMEHPEFHSFYHNYLKQYESFRRITFLLKLYETITRHLPEQYNGYHKLFVLYRLLTRSNLLQNISQPVLTLESKPTHSN